MFIPVGDGGNGGTSSTVSATKIAKAFDLGELAVNAAKVKSGESVYGMEEEKEEAFSVQTFRERSSGISVRIRFTGGYESNGLAINSGSMSFDFTTNGTSVTGFSASVTDALSVTYEGETTEITMNTPAEGTVESGITVSGGAIQSFNKKDVRVSVSSAIQITVGDTTVTPSKDGQSDPTVWDGKTYDTSWYSEGGTEFTINTAAELKGLSIRVNSGTNFEGATITIGRSINLAGNEWTPIGTEANPFKGTIQGGTGIEISNLMMSSEVLSPDEANDQHVAGFIGFLSGGGIKNITFTGADISVGEDVAAAVVAGFMNAGTIDNVKVNTANIRGKYESDMGAIAGKLYDSGSITNCSVTDTSIILDATGNNYNSCNIGGIVGSFSHKGEQTHKAISGNTVDLSAASQAEFDILNYQEIERQPIGVGGIIGQIGGKTNGTVSGNTLIIANPDQIADGAGGIITGYSQEFYGYSENEGRCDNTSWKSENNHDSPKVSEKFGDNT